MYQLTNVFVMRDIFKIVHNYVNLVILAGYKFVKLKNFSLTCTGESDNECDSCESDDFRKTIDATTHKCLCMDKYFDAGSFACSPCHYSWFLNKIIIQ